MSADGNVDELLSQWDRAERKPSAEELCADCPELLPELRRQMERLDAADRLLAGPAAAASTPPPEVIGNYKLLEPIGEGGMGMVWRAQQQNPSRFVALKVIRAGLASPAALRRFEYEAQVLGRLEHPGIARIYEAGAYAAGGGRPQPFFAMELVTGRPLTAWSSQRRLDVPARLGLVIKVCEGVHHAHQKGVIHRDLKPSNILVDDDGKPKVLDFGVARAVDADMGAPTLHTGTGSIIGTLAYMSPEQAAGQAESLDTRSDVYALGVIAYELLAGKLPYDLGNKTLPQAIRIIAERDPPPLGNVDRRLRGDLQTIMAKAMAKEKERRYQSAAELAADIRRFLDHEPIQARPATTLYQVRKFARRHRGVVVAAAALLVVLVCGIVTTSVQAVRARRAELARQQERDAAREQRDTAEKRLRQVQALADVLTNGFRAGNRSTTTQPAEPEPIAPATLGILDRLTEEAWNDPDLLRGIGAAYMALGLARADALQAQYRDLTVTKEQRDAKSGATTKPGDAKGGATTEQREADADEPPELPAEASLQAVAELYNKGVGCFERAVTFRQGDRTGVGDLILAQMRVAEWQVLRGDSVAAEAAYWTAVKEADRLARAQPDAANRDLLVQTVVVYCDELRVFASEMEEEPGGSVAARLYQQMTKRCEAVLTDKLAGTEAALAAWKCRADWGLAEARLAEDEESGEVRRTRLRTADQQLGAALAWAKTATDELTAYDGEYTDLLAKCRANLESVRKTMGKPAAPPVVAVATRPAGMPSRARGNDQSYALDRWDQAMAEVSRQVADGWRPLTARADGLAQVRADALRLCDQAALAGAFPAGRGRKELAARLAIVGTFFSDKGPDTAEPLLQRSWEMMAPPAAGTIAMREDDLDALMIAGLRAQNLVLQNRAPDAERFLRDLQTRQRAANASEAAQLTVRDHLIAVLLSQGKADAARQVVAGGAQAYRRSPGHPGWATRRQFDEAANQLTLLQRTQRDPSLLAQPSRHVLNLSADVGWTAGTAPASQRQTLLRAALLAYQLPDPLWHCGADRAAAVLGQVLLEEELATPAPGTPATAPTVP